MEKRTFSSIYSFQAYYNQYNGGHFFDHDTLKFFGERLSEMRVLKDTSIITDCMGEKVECYCISSKQHKRPGKPRVYHYFDIATFEHRIPANY